MGCTLHDHGHSHGGVSHGHSHDSKNHSHDTDEENPNTDLLSSWEKKSLLNKQSSKKKETNINVRAAFIHVVGDFVQSLGVFIAALVIYLKVCAHFLFIRIFSIIGTCSAHGSLMFHSMKCF